MSAIVPIRFRTEMARTLHRDIVNTYNVPDGELNTLNTLDSVSYTYSLAEGVDTISGLDVQGRTLSYIPGRIELFRDGVKMTNAEFTANNGTSVDLTYAIGSDETVFEVYGLNFASTDVNSANDTITITAHGFTTGDGVYLYQNTSKTIPGLTNFTEYYVRVIDANTIKLAVSSANAIAGVTIEITQPDNDVTFNTSTDVNVSTDVITSSSHPFTTGDAVLYNNGGGTTIGGLTNNTTYYVISTGANTIKLATTYANAVAGTPVAIDLTSTGTGAAHSLTADYSDYYLYPSDNFIISFVNDRITLPNHGFVTGEHVRYEVDGSGFITGLTDGTDYYIIKVDDDTVRLATTYANAIVDTAVNLQNTKLYAGNFTLFGPLEQTIVVNTFTLYNYPNPRDYYHVFLANTLNWTNEPTPNTPVDSRSDDSKVKRSILGIKRVNPSDTCLMVRRIDWVSGTIYDRYDDIANLEDADFYVFNSNNYRIYKCLNNNGVLKFFDGSSASIVSTTNDTITIPTHGFSTGESVTYGTGGGTPLGGLVNNTLYYVVVINANTIKLATSFSNATAPTPSVINITSLGTGVSHKFYKGNPSTVLPSHSEVGPKTLADGYVWQLLYEVPAADRVKFLTDDLIPVKFYGTSTRFDHNGTISEVLLESTGNSYTSAPTIQILGDGIGAEATATLTGSLVTDIVLTNGGSGYSFAFVQITGGGGSGATASVVIETTDLPNVINQNVAGYAVATNGQIDFIEVTKPGEGYVQSDVRVSITGDGDGATAQAVVSDGEIVAINVTDRGTGYTFADVTIIGTAPEDTATARAIIAPQGGHGANIPQELFATSLAVNVNVEDFQEDFFLNNDFRQYGLIKNVHSYGSIFPFTGSTGNACAVVSVPSGDFTKYNNDDVITTSGGGKYLVAYKTQRDSEYLVYLLPIINNIDENSFLDNETTGNDMTSPDSIVSVTLPEISQNSGDVIYFVNTESLERQDEQNENIKFYINF